MLSRRSDLFNVLIDALNTYLENNSKKLLDSSEPRRDDFINITVAVYACVQHVSKAGFKYTRVTKKHVEGFIARNDNEKVRLPYIKADAFKYLSLDKLVTLNKTLRDYIMTALTEFETSVGNSTLRTLLCAALVKNADLALALSLTFEDAAKKPTLEVVDAPGSLMSLSAEILQNILSYLTPVEFLNLQLLSKRFVIFLSDIKLWQPAIQKNISRNNYISDVLVIGQRSANETTTKFYFRVLKVSELCKDTREEKRTQLLANKEAEKAYTYKQTAVEIRQDFLEGLGKGPELLKLELTSLLERAEREKELKAAQEAPHPLIFQL